jgi:hypothetical protein
MWNGFPGKIAAPYKPGGSSVSKCGSYPLKMRLEPLSMPENVLRNALSLRTQKIGKSVNRLANAAVDECIAPRELDISSGSVYE